MCNLGEGLVERTAKEVKYNTTKSVSEKFILNMRKSGLSIERIAEIAEMNVDSINKIIETCQHNKSLAVEQ